MKTTFLFLAFLLISTISLAEEKRIAASFIFDRSEPAPALSEDMGVFSFKFNGLEKEDLNVKITLSCDGGENETIKLKDGKFDYNAPAGTHRFVIYINDKYFELYSHNLIIGGQEKHFYSVNTIMTLGLQIEVDKPVIYLYPEESTSFEVSVIPKGDMAFTYPKYDENWSGMMHPNSDLEINGEIFNYLFWESKQEMNALNPKETAGFVIQKEEILSFLEEKLNQVGFTAKERADFITFWAPQMEKHEQVFITFHQDADCDMFAELNISPTPENLYRFYMSWGSYDGDVVPESQELTSFQRSGFTAIEWGGQEIPTITNTLAL